MSPDRRQKNMQWQVADEHGQLYGGLQWGPVVAALLMDIRDELQTLNRVFACPNFTGIPETLRGIRKGTNRIPSKPRRKR